MLHNLTFGEPRHGDKAVGPPSPLAPLFAAYDATPAGAKGEIDIRLPVGLGIGPMDGASGVPGASPMSTSQEEMARQVADLAVKALRKYAKGRGTIAWRLGAVIVEGAVRVFWTRREKAGRPA